MTNDTPQSYDLAASSGGMSLLDLERLLTDIENQPEWRSTADRAARYYDGKQLSGQRIAEMLESGEPPTVINLLSGAINGALGQEERTRLDWAAKADTDAYQDVADVINVKLAEAKRETSADTAISDAYKGQIVPGIGWVEVSRNPDPLAYPYRVEHVHRSEVWWDWRAKKIDKSDARWICRQAWVDLDEIEHALPQYRAIFRMGCNSSNITDSLMRTITGSNETFANQLADTRNTFSRYEEEWLDNSGRRRVRMYWIWYRQRATAIALVVGTKRVKFRPENPLHQEMVRRGIAQLITGPSYKIRQALFCGPYRLADEETAWREYPIIPFVGFEDDEWGTPYGLAMGMLDPQDEYNERRSRMRWLLKACQTFIDSDALDSKYNNFRQFAQEIMRPDAQFILNPKRTNGPAAVRVEHNQSLVREQYEIMQDAKQLIQEQPRIYSAMLGDAPAGVTSGLAINSLVEQGMVALGETNGNYRTGRARVGNALVQLIVEDHNRPQMPVLVGSGKAARVVVLNTFDEQTKLPKNVMQDAPITLGLGDIPSTAGYKMQQQVALAQMIQAVGPDPVARAVLIPDWLETTDLPHREERASWMRKQYGVPEPGERADPRVEQEQMQQAMAKKQAAEQAQLRMATAAAQEKEASAGLKVVQAEKADAERKKIMAETAQMAANEDDAIAASLDEARQQVAA
jgi:hypothetical protein